MSMSTRSLRKKRDRALDRRQNSRLLLDRADELIIGDGICGPRRPGFVVVRAENPFGEDPFSEKPFAENPFVEMARKQG